MFEREPSCSVELKKVGKKKIKSSHNWSNPQGLCVAFGGVSAVSLFFSLLLIGTILCVYSTGARAGESGT